MGGTARTGWREQSGQMVEGLTGWSRAVGQTQAFIVSEEPLQGVELSDRSDLHVNIISLDGGLRLDCWEVRGEVGKPVDRLGMQSRQEMWAWIRVVAAEVGRKHSLNILSVQRRWRTISSHVLREGFMV